MSKLAAERIGAQVLSATPTRFSVVRYFNTYGPGQTFTPYVGVVTIFATRLHRGESITIFGDGAQARDFVHVDDIVQGTILTLDGPPGVYNLGTGRATTVNRVAELLRSHIHPAAAIEHEPAQPDLQPFTRFPTWMWRNDEFRDLVVWLHGFNLDRPEEDRVGLYGLDLYSLYTSLDAVLAYLDDVDPDTVRAARARYGCLTPWSGDPASYGRAAITGRYRECEADVVATLDAADARRPNVLFIISDDLTATALSCYGNTICQTPNIDRLAASGTRFTRALCQGTYCGPSRASFLSGYYPHATGVLGYTSPRPAIGERATWPQHFKNAGYYTARVSKIYHMGVPGGIEYGGDGRDHDGGNGGVTWTRQRSPSSRRTCARARPTPARRSTGSRYATTCGRWRSAPSGRSGGSPSASASTWSSRSRTTPPPRTTMSTR